MSKAFDDIVHSGYFVSFGSLTPDQVFCKEFTQKHLNDLLAQRQRDKFLHEVKVCACGYDEADEDEPMDEDNFSQYQFFQPYTESIIFFEDKFDFLIKCVAHGVCKIAPGFEERYQKALLDSLTFREITEPVQPEYVLELRQLSTPRTVGEQNRSAVEQEDHFQSYLQRRNSFTNGVKDELARLEREQRHCEMKKNSVMGWDLGDPNDMTHLEHEKKKASESKATETAKEDGDNAPAAAAESPEAAPEQQEGEKPDEENATQPADGGDDDGNLLGLSEKTPMLNLLLQLQADKEAASA